MRLQPRTDPVQLVGSQTPYSPAAHCATAYTAIQRHRRTDSRTWQMLPKPTAFRTTPLSPLDITVQCSSRVRAPRRCETTTRPQPDPCTASLLAQPQGGKPLAHPTSDTEREGEAGEALRAPKGERVV